MTLNLTDDEVVAAVAMCQARYDGPIPTIAMNHDDEAVAAGWRGRRSLAVRDFIASDGALSDAIAEIVRAFGAADAVEIYAGDAAGERTSMGVSIVAYRVAENVLVERTSAAGVHAFEWAPAREAFEALAAVLTSALEARRSVKDSTSLLLALKSDRPAYVRVDGGSVSRAELDAAGAPGAWVDSDEATVSAEVRRVLGA